MNVSQAPGRNFPRVTIAAPETAPFRVTADTRTQCATLGMLATDVQASGTSLFRDQFCLEAARIRRTEVAVIQ